ncbi:hypothetical protein EDD37DRAFT_614726 [Exophiala viscosa]|uniref:uncharacterized protein n=1 Tax=Exophiala viscosa TaxID=2486360 RepID=UPI0021958A04|nr:hypothetical protein EDD37DRAFT_614726 [Exophiala viscosa]
MDLVVPILPASLQILWWKTCCARNLQCLRGEVRPDESMTRYVSTCPLCLSTPTSSSDRGILLRAKTPDNCGRDSEGWSREKTSSLMMRFHKCWEYTNR